MKLCEIKRKAIRKAVKLKPKLLQMKLIVYNKTIMAIFRHKNK